MLGITFDFWEQQLDALYTDKATAGRAFETFVGSLVCPGVFNTVSCFTVLLEFNRLIGAQEAKSCRNEITHTGLIVQWLFPCAVSLTATDLTIT